MPHSNANANLAVGDEESTKSSIRIERLPGVLARTGMGRSWIYAAIQSGVFPKPVKLSARAVGWRSEDIDAWLASRAA